VNASYSIVAGMDFGWKTLLDLGSFGQITTSLDASHLIQQQQTFGDVTYYYAGTVGPTALSGSTGTPANRGMLTIDWTRGPCLWAPSSTTVARCRASISRWARRSPVCS